MSESEGPRRRIRVLVVDDSPTIRELYKRTLSRDPEIEVVGTAPDPYVARDLIVELKPDVLTLDVEMPRMDGITFLKKLQQHHPIPVVVVSSLTQRGGQKAMEALEAGAVDVLCKPAEDYSVAEMIIDLVRSVKGAAHVRLDRLAAPPRARRPAVAAGHLPYREVLAIGASTGGTVALEHILTHMPEDGPATLIVQHMPPVFTASFAQRLNTLSAMEVREAKDGDALEPGVALIAPGGMHLLMRSSGESFLVAVRGGPPVNGHRPSVDVLFRSVAECAGAQSVGVVLTGMGKDGAAGLKMMRDGGARTFAQDEASSVVFGMPKAALDAGGTDDLVPLTELPQTILGALNRSRY